MCLAPSVQAHQNLHALSYLLIEIIAELLVESSVDHALIRSCHRGGLLLRDAEPEVLCNPQSPFEVAVCNQTSNFIGFSFHLSHILTFSVRFWAYLHSNPLPTGVNRFGFCCENFGFTA